MGAIPICSGLAANLTPLEVVERLLGEQQAFSIVSFEREVVNGRQLVLWSLEQMQEWDHHHAPHSDQY
jgi:hypothetical protein